jgi:hypothetical protein
MKTRLFMRVLWIALPLLIVIAVPGNGFSTLLEYQQTEIFLNSNALAAGAPLAQVDVTVYAPGELTTYAGGTLLPTDYLYQYTIKNIDSTLSHPAVPISIGIRQLVLDLKEGAPVSQLWPGASGSYIPTQNLSTGDVYFSVLSLLPDQSIVLYIVSPAAPELVAASIQATFGSAGGISLWAPDPTERTSLPIPEPATLLLLGSGLIGIGLARRKR